MMLRFIASRYSHLKRMAAAVKERSVVLLMATNGKVTDMICCIIL